VVIQISPHVETAYAPAYAEIAQTGIAAEESLSIQGDENRADQSDEDGLSGPGSFKEILAGLFRETGTETGGPPAETTPIPNALLGESAVFVEADATVEAGEKDFTGFGRNKGAAVGKLETGLEPGKTEKVTAKSDTIDEELSTLDFSEEDKNILLAVELLLTRSAEKPLLDEEAAAVEIHLETREAAGEAAALFAARDEGGEMPPVPAGEAPELVDSSKERRFGGDTGTRSDGNTGRAAVNGFDAIEFAVSGSAALEPDTEPPKQSTSRENGVGKDGRLEEVRGRDRRRDRISFEVRDLRAGSSQAGGENQRPTASIGDRIQGESETHEITLELRLPNQGQDMPPSETAWETRAGHAFEDLLARELHQNFNNDIVRHASMVLRDEGAGTIRLALKPDTLGNVKIRLEMAENKITGHIIVESEEAMRAFEREIHSLEQAFKESGFQSANLEMSFAANGGGADQHWQGSEAFLPERLAAFHYDASLGRLEIPLSDTVDVYQRELTSINMLA
jgi:hypothetical protein